MDDTKKALLSIDIDTASLAQNVADAKSKVSDLTAQLKALKGTTQENSVEAVNLAAQLKNARAEVQSGTTTLAQYDKALNSVKGSQTQQRIEINLLQKQWDDLSKSQQQNADVGGKIQARLQALSKDTQGVDQSVNNFKSTIGSYENSIVSALTKTGLLGSTFAKAGGIVNDVKGGFDALSKTVENAASSAGIFTNKSTIASNGLIKFTGNTEKATEGLTVLRKDTTQAYNDFEILSTNTGIASKALDLTKVSTDNVSTGMRLLKLAIAETGIGLLIIALGSLITYFQSTNEGAKKFEVITNGIKSVLQAVMKVLAPIGKALFDTFTQSQGPMMVVKGVFGNIVDVIAITILQIKTLGTVLYDVFTGHFKDAFDDAKQGIADIGARMADMAQNSVNMYKGIAISAVDLTKNMVKAGSEISKVDFSKTIKDSAAITVERQKLTKAEREWSEEKIKQQGEVDLLTKKIRDQGISEKERIADAEKAKTIRETIFKTDLKNAQTNLDLVQREQALNSKKDYQAITDAKNRVQEIINAKDSEVQGIENREDRVGKSRETAAQKAKKLFDEAESERMSSIARTAQTLYDSYADEISKTDDKYRKLIEKYKNYKDTVKQLESERVAELKAIQDKFNKEAVANLESMNTELADLRAKASTDELQKQLDAIDQQTADKIKKLDTQTSAIDLKIAQQVNAVNDLRAKGENDAADALEKSIAIEITELETAGKIKLALIKQQAVDEAKIKSDAEYKKNGDKLSGDITGDEISGNVKKEYADRAKLLKLEHDQAVAAAKLKGEDTYKIDQEYQQKSIKLAQDKQVAQIKADEYYLDAVKTISGNLMDILGKNSEAYKAAFLAHQTAQAGMVIIDTYKTVMSIWSTDSEIPFVGVPKAIAETAIAVTAGAASLAKINSAKGFARGGVYQSDGTGGLLSGPGTGTSDSINARLSNGESIINARSTALYAPLLSAINQAGGGRGFHAPSPVNHFAAGGLFDGIGVYNDSQNVAMNNFTLKKIQKSLDTMPSKMPRQVAIIEEIQAGLANKVMLQNMSNF